MGDGAERTGDSQPVAAREWCFVPLPGDGSAGNKGSSMVVWFGLVWSGSPRVGGSLGSWERRVTSARALFAGHSSFLHFLVSGPLSCSSRCITPCETITLSVVLCEAMDPPLFGPSMLVNAQCEVPHTRSSVPVDQNGRLGRNESVAMLVGATEYRRQPS